MMATLVFAAKKYQSLIQTFSCSQDQRRQDAASGQSAKMSWGLLWSWAIVSSQTLHQVCLNFTPAAAAEVDLFSASMSVPEWSSLEKTAWSPWKLPGNWQNSRTVSCSRNTISFLTQSFNSPPLFFYSLYVFLFPRLEANQGSYNFRFSLLSSLQHYIYSTPTQISN